MKEKLHSADVVARMVSPTQLAEADFPAELGRPAQLERRHTQLRRVFPGLQEQGNTHQLTQEANIRRTARHALAVQAHNVGRRASIPTLQLRNLSLDTSYFLNDFVIVL